MSGVRVLVGTRKGAFILTSDGTRRQWDVAGPHFAGWEIYHLKGSPVDPEPHLRVPDQRLVRADHPALGRRREDLAPARYAAGEPTTAPDGTPKGESNKFVYDASPETGKPLTTHQWYDGTQQPVGVQARVAPRAFADRSGHGLRRGRGRGPLPLHRRRPDLAGAGRAARPRHRAAVAAGRRRDVPAHHPPRSEQPGRIYVAISAAGAFRSDDGGKTWKPINRGLRSQYIPDPTAEVGHCVHRIAMHPSRPNVLFMQKHWDVMRSDDGGDYWREVSGNLPTDFGFVIDVHAHEPETVYVVPIKSDSRALPARRQAARLPQPDRRQRVGGAHEWPAAEGLLRQRAARRHVRRLARSRAASTSAPPADRSTPRPTPATTGRRSSGTFRAVLSVEVQTLP